MANRSNTAHQDLFENKSDNGLDAESEKYRIMEFYKGREVVCLLDKHEDVEEFIGEFFPSPKVVGCLLEGVLIREYMWCDQAKSVGSRQY